LPHESGGSGDIAGLNQANEDHRGAQAGKEEFRTTNPINVEGKAVPDIDGGGQDDRDGSGLRRDGGSDSASGEGVAAEAASRAFEIAFEEGIFILKVQWLGSGRLLGPRRSYGC
jgi:hypothetical protein